MIGRKYLLVSDVIIVLIVHVISLDVFNRFQVIDLVDGGLGGRVVDDHLLGLGL